MSRVPTFGKVVKESKTTTVVLGGKEVVIKKTSFRSFAKIVRIAGPYIERLIQAFLASRPEEATEMRKAMADIVGVGNKSDEVSVSERDARASEAYDTMRRVIGQDLIAMIWQVPEDLQKIFALLINIDPDADERKDEAGYDAWVWFQNDVELDELLNAFTVIDELNEFENLGRLLVKTFRDLSAKYQVSFPGVDFRRRAVTTSPDAPKPEETEEPES